MAGYIGSKAVSVNTTSATISDDLSVDGVTFNVDSSNNRIGIGTTAPSDIVEIDVAGSNTGLTLTDNGDDYFPQIKLDSNRSGAGQGLGKFSWHWNGTEVARIEGAAGVDATNKDDGSMLFNTRASGASMATQMTILHDGTVSVARGNLVIGTAGKGIDFSAQTATSATAASATAELLDHYEEGTWTASFAAGSGSITISAAAGSYTKIGRQVTVQGAFSVGSVSSPSGDWAVSGLPFNSASGAAFSTAGTIWVNTLNDTTGKTIQCRMDTATDDLHIFDLAGGNAGGAGGFTKAGSILNISVTYFAA